MNSIKGREVVIVVNKIDLKKRIDISIAKKFFPKATIVHVSAINSTGIGKLEKIIQGIIFKGRVPTADFVHSSNDRQIASLRRSMEDIKEAIDGFKKGLSMDCVAIYVRLSIESIGEITGHTITEEALDKIFSEFCIGK